MVSDVYEKLCEIIGELEVAMMTTLAPDGRLHSRPMIAQKTGCDGTLWFMTAIDSGKVDEIRDDQRVSVTFASPHDHKYVAINGRARMVDDRQKIHQFWSPSFRTWFPEGKDDPNIGLLQVTIDDAEYWATPHHGALRLGSVLRGFITGRPYEQTEHEKLSPETPRAGERLPGAGIEHQETHR